MILVQDLGRTPLVVELPDVFLALVRILDVVGLLLERLWLNSRGKGGLAIAMSHTLSLAIGHVGEF